MNETAAVGLIKRQPIFITVVLYTIIMQIKLFDLHNLICIIQNKLKRKKALKTGLFFDTFSFITAWPSR